MTLIAGVVFAALMRDAVNEAADPNTHTTIITRVSISVPRKKKREPDKEGQRTS
ncbi:predicted protein [Plenodomus lingam JN3]|uniref:Predicted protein n=1 Tax=Leptosphaeria maculans (strain JN3 / isolate v23.1.3 / race Av1-4-5-6-7-8) TaxID=985895 RepID=E5AC33_LEPMJ|nr:predicted protein [Plenodomus lingam JN3]CBY00144.1 predicted protein [Plenodomus lingam JN3]